VLRAVDGGYMSVYVVKPISTARDLNDTDYKETADFKVRVIFFRSEKQDRTGPFLIYRPNYSLIKLVIMGCFNDNRFGYKCVLSEVTGGKLQEQQRNNYVVIRFLSSGGVNGIINLEVPKTIQIQSVMEVRSLPFGGFIFPFFSNSSRKFAHIFDNNGKNYDTFELPSNQSSLLMGLLSNNTLWTLASNIRGSWSIVTRDLPKFIEGDFICPVIYVLLIVGRLMYFMNFMIFFFYII